MANLITVQLRRGEGQPWGFRLQGGKDFSAPLVLQRVNGGSVADQAGLMPGDALVKVNSTDVFSLRHKEAQDVIVAAGNSFELTVSRGTAWRPSVTPTGSIPSPSPSLPGNITPVTKTSLAATPQPAQHIGSGHNQAAKPFPAQQQQQQPQEQVNGSDPIKSIVNMQYNTPVAMYSDETIAETLSSQAEVLAGGVLGVNFKKNEKKYSPANSEVYKLLHADCFKCATCGTSLKNQGYFNLNGKLYCDIHARLAALQSPPPGTNGMVPVTIPKPGQKSGVQAISAALNAHANLNGRSQSPYAANLHLPPPPPPTTTTISSGSSSTHQSPSHSRSSSTTSSSGYCNSSSLSPVQSNKVSPLHSRTSSENELHQYPAAKALPSCAPTVYGSDFSFPPPPPPPLLQLATVPAAGMENPEVVPQQPPPVEPVDPAAFGPNGLAVADPTADSTDSAGAAAAGSNGDFTTNDYGFLYKTIGGAVIRSVFPPGGAGSRYKNQNNITPKPFGAAPSPLVQPPSSFPPVAGSVPTPFSAAITGQAPAPAAAAPQPASYPPAPQAAAAPAVQAPAPAPAPAVVAPAAAPAAAVPTPQEMFFQKKSPVKQTAPSFAPGAATTLLDSSVSKLASINGNSDYRKQASNVLKEMLEARLKKHESTPVQQQQEQVRLKNKENLLSNGGDTLHKRLLNPSHPMSRIIDMCDSSVPAPPPMPKANAPFQQPHKDLKPQPVIPNNNISNIHVNNVVLRPKHNNHNGNGNGLEETLAQLSNRRKVSSELTSHARDRRSYVEKNNNNNSSQTKSTIAEESAAKKPSEEAVTPPTAVNKVPICNKCNHKITTGPFITALGRIWCPDHFICHNGNCKRPLADIGFVEEKGDLYCEYCFEEFLAPVCSKCNARVKGDCLNAIGKQFHPECFKCTYCGKQFGNSPFFLEEGDPYCETDWNELFTTKCFACGFPVEAGDKWVEALNNNYHSQCFNCTSCKKNLEGQSFFAKGGRPFCKNHAR